jgi:hypothetical protein
MISKKEHALMVDLAKLLKKHGPEAFESLSGSVFSPEFTEKFSSVLLKVAKIERNSVSRVNSSTRGFSKLKKTDPEKYEIIKSFVAKYKEGQILTSLKEVSRFVAENNLPEIKAASRSRAISPLTHSLLKLPSDQIQKLLTELLKQGKSDSSLSQWSDIISKGMSRSAKPRIESA